MLEVHEPQLVPEAIFFSEINVFHLLSNNFNKQLPSTLKKIFLSSWGHN